jgi:hypothetical protein
MYLFAPKNLNARYIQAPKGLNALYVQAPKGWNDLYLHVSKKSKNKTLSEQFQRSNGKIITKAKPGPLTPKFMTAHISGLGQALQ